MLPYSKKVCGINHEISQKKVHPSARWAFCLWAPAETPAGIKGNRWCLPDSSGSRLMFFSVKDGCILDTSVARRHRFSIREESESQSGYACWHHGPCLERWGLVHQNWASQISSLPDGSVGESTIIWHVTALWRIKTCHNIFAQTPPAKKNNNTNTKPVTTSAVRFFPSGQEIWAIYSKPRLHSIP